MMETAVRGTDPQEPAKMGIAIGKRRGNVRVEKEIEEKTGITEKGRTSRERMTTGKLDTEIEIIVPKRTGRKNLRSRTGGGVRGSASDLVVLSGRNVMVGQLALHDVEASEKYRRISICQRKLRKQTEMQILGVRPRLAMTINPLDHLSCLDRSRPGPEQGMFGKIGLLPATQTEHLLFVQCPSWIG